MMSFSGRRVILACLVVAAALVAVIAPGAASAATQTSDLDAHCEGANIKGHGSTFQAPILVKWTEHFNHNKNAEGCAGEKAQGKGKPTVEYLHTGTNAGSGACLHGDGAETTNPVEYKEFQFCGTDEAPNETQKAEIEEEHKAESGFESESLEEIPVAQGAVTIIVHLPNTCKASSEITSKGAKKKLGRLVLDQKTIQGVYDGAIKNWNELLANQEKEGSGTNKGAGKDKIECTEPKELEKTIVPVVRLDHSGTTHIFKEFLGLVNKEPIEMEEYATEIGGKKTGCKPEGVKGPEKKTWAQVAEACENQRWPLAAHVERGLESGNQGVLKSVNKEPSRIGYADLAVAREEGFFSKKSLEGGEATEGEQNPKFWAEVQDTKNPESKGFFEPSTDGDTEAFAESECKATKFTEEAGKKFPPASTRKPWNEAKAELVEKEYSICGLTYDLANRQYGYFPGFGFGGTTAEEETGKGEATTVHDFLLWALSTKSGGGQTEIKGSDYQKLPEAVREEAEDGVEEIGYRKAGTEDAKEKT
jgi:ABC-type phosphate transport system substrate-binding protein